MTFLKIVPEETLQQAIRWARTAHDDLNTAVILFEARRYPQAIYQLQQAVEKFSKSLGISEQVLHPENGPRSLGHNPDQLLNRFAQQAGIADDWRNTNVSDELRHAEPDTGAVKGRLQLLRESWEKFDRDFLSDTESRTERDLEMLGARGKNESVRSIVRLLNFDAGVLAMLHSTIHTLACLTAPHHMSSRYPDGEEHEPGQTYTDEHVLVREFPTMIDLLHKFLELHRFRVYKMLPDTNKLIGRQSNTNEPS